MFFEGTVQEGIASAVQEAKLVICFVTNEGDESEQWENEFLTDGSIVNKIESEAVLLRLLAGSEEANYLAAIFPLPKTPTLVLIRNGELKEYIAAGVSKVDFLARVQKALGLVQSAPSQPEVAEQPRRSDVPQVQVGHRSSVPQATVPVPAAAPAAPAPAPAVPEASSGNSSSSQVTPPSSSYGDQTSESERKKEEAETERRRREKGKSRVDPEADGDSEGAGLPREQVKKASEVYKKVQQGALDERRRILQQIEHDKIARKAREDERRAARQAALQAQETGDGAGDATGGTATASPITISSGNSTRSNNTNKQSATCALQVRDFDGSTIRTRMPSSSTLGRDVRKWVDENRPVDGSRPGPYTFRVVLTPLPNRAIDPTEEDASLQDLGLSPSSTLILVPVASRFSTAYSDPGAGFFARILAFFMGIINSIALFFSTLFSTSGPPAAAAPEQEPSSPPSSSARGPRQDSARVSGFRNPRDDRRDYQLYNGNSLNFEPRPDEDEEGSK